MKLKVNLQKIIAVTVSTAVITFAFASFPAYADSDPIMTNQEYYAAQSYLIAKYKDGDISYSEYQQQSQAVTDEFVTNNTIGGVLQSGALNASNTVSAVSQKIGNTVQKYGDAAREYISDYISDFINSYTKLSDKPTTDLKGSVAMLKRLSSTGEYVIYYGNASGEVWYNGSSKMVELQYSRAEYYDERGRIYYTAYDDIVGMEYYSYNTFLYGSWKLRDDGSDVPTDDEFQTVSDYDFSEVPEKDLEDLLKKLLNEMELKEPDLSSIEGLLKAIYAKLGTLDSDDDNAALSLINSSINKLIAENKESNEELIKKLENLKLENDNQAILDKLNEIFPEYDYDTDISRTEELKVLFLTKWGFVEELRTLIDRFMSSYERKSSLGTMDNVIHVKYNPSNGSFGNVILNHSGVYDIKFDIFEPYLPTVRGLIAAFIYLSYAFNTYRKIPSYIRGGDTE